VDLAEPDQRVAGDVFEAGPERLLRRGERPVGAGGEESRQGKGRDVAKAHGQSGL
jgi:hypothetical protein